MTDEHTGFNGLLAPAPSDEDVARWDLRAGREALLREIVAQPRTARAQRPNRRSAPRGAWTMVGAVAATVAITAGAVLGALALSGDLGDEPAPADRSDGAPQRVSSSVYEAGDWVVADPAANWEWRRFSDSSENLDRELDYRVGDVEVQINLRPAARHEGHRVEVSAPTPLTVLGLTAQQYEYGAEDHTIVTEPVGEYFAEIRIERATVDEIPDLLSQLVAVDDSDIVAFLPAQFIPRADQGPVLAEMTAGLDLPPALTSEDIAAAVPGVAADRYTIGFIVITEMTCGWLDAYEQNPNLGSEAQAALEELSDGQAVEETTNPFLADSLDTIAEAMGNGATAEEARFQWGSCN